MQVYQCVSLFGLVHASSVCVQASAAVETEITCADRCAVWSQSSRELAQALHACCSMPAGKSWHGRRGLSYTKLHKLTQHTRGHTHTPRLSSAMAYCPQPHHARTMS